jgi:hypothetical protein
MQPAGRVSKKVAMFMHGTPLDRHVAPEGGERFIEAHRAINPSHGKSRVKG